MKMESITCRDRGDIFYNEYTYGDAQDLIALCKEKINKTAARPIITDKEVKGVRELVKLLGLEYEEVEGGIRILLGSYNNRDIDSVVYELRFDLSKSRIDHYDKLIIRLMGLHHGNSVRLVGSDIPSREFFEWISHDLLEAGYTIDFHNNGHYKYVDITAE